MSDQFYSDAGLYDRLFPGGQLAADFYGAEADHQGGDVLELGCGTASKLNPIASNGHPSVGMDLSAHKLAEAQRKANERGVEVQSAHGDMREFDWAEPSTSCSPLPTHCSICTRVRSRWPASGRCGSTCRPARASSSTC